MDADERFHQKRPGYPNRHVSVDGQVVIKTCANGSLKYHKYPDIEAVEATIEN